MEKLTEYEILALNKLGETIHNGKWSNEGMVQCVELLLEFLNPIPISEHQKQTGLSYNGIKKQKQYVKILGKKYILDND
jgi:hypothetical protein